MASAVHEVRHQDSADLEGMPPSPPVWLQGAEAEPTRKGPGWGTQALGPQDRP